MGRQRLLLQAREDSLEIVKQESAQVMAEAITNHDPQSCQVSAIGREGVGRDEPATLTQGRRHVKDREVLDLITQLESEDWKLAPISNQVKGAKLGKSATQGHGHIATILLDASIAI